MLIAIGTILSIGAASADTMYLQMDKYYVEHPGETPDCDKYNISVEYVGNNMTVQIIEPTVVEQPDAHLKAIGLMFAAYNPVVKVTLLDDTEMDYTDDFAANFGALGEFNKNVTFDFKTTGGVIIDPKPRAYKLEFLNPIVFDSDNTEGFKAAVHIGGLDTTYTADGSDSVKVGDGECDDGGGGTQEIPEFPTIALPIAAIIGLAFIFQSRKE